MKKQVIKKTGVNISGKKAVIIARIVGFVWATLIALIVSSLAHSMLSDDYLPRPDFILEDAETGNAIRVYGRIYDSYNNFQDEEKHPEYKECVGIADYTKYAALYRMYKESGDTDKQNIYKKCMEEAVIKMGKLDYVKEDIDNKLGIK